jgi:signal transduction histidine kinase
VAGDQGTDCFRSHATFVGVETNVAVRLRALQAVTDPALSQLGIATLLDEISSRLSDALSADAIALHLVDDDAERLSLKLLHGTKRGPHACRSITLGDGLVGGVAATGKPVVVESLLHEDGVAPIGNAGLRSIVAVPLRCLRRVTGVLSVGTTSRRSFDEHDLVLVSTAADRIACAIDRTRLHDAEERARASAEAALRARDEFLSMASHELKTPMTSLVLLVQCLMKAAPRAPTLSEIQRRLESIERQVMRLAELTENLLDMCRIHASGIGLELGAVDLGDVARTAIVHAAERLDNSRSPVSLHVASPAVGRWDRKRCEQMVMHLLSNAATYGEHRPIDVDVTADSKTARITVRDHGLGIALQQQDRIFDRYARAPEAKNVAGLGLGLWVVSRIAEALGGSVSVESAPGEGSAFTVELPLSGPTAHAAVSMATTM